MVYLHVGYIRMFLLLNLNIVFCGLYKYYTIDQGNISINATNRSELMIISKYGHYNTLISLKYKYYCFVFDKQ